MCQTTINKSLMDYLILQNMKRIRKLRSLKKSALRSKLKSVKTLTHNKKEETPDKYPVSSHEKSEEDNDVKKAEGPKQLIKFTSNIEPRRIMPRDVSLVSAHSRREKVEKVLAELKRLMSAKKDQPRPQEKQQIKKTIEEVFNVLPFPNAPLMYLGRGTRPRERSIQQAINIVYQWRQLFRGVLVKKDETGERQLQRYSLQEAAKMLNMSFKTVNNYRYMI